MTQQILSALTETEKDQLKQLDFIIRHSCNIIEVHRAKAEILSMVQKVKERT